MSVHTSSRCLSHGAVTVSHSGDPEDLVADWEPRNIHGQLADGTPVSIIGAQGGKKRSTQLFDLEYRQVFGTIRHVILAYVDDRQTFAHCRFRLDGPNWFRYADGEAVTSDGGRLVGKHLPEHARDAIMFRNGIETYKLPETVPVFEGQTRVY
jgi:hypothetical protein